MTRVGRKNLTTSRVKSIIGRISGAWGHVFRRHTLCLWLTIRGGRIRVAHPRKHQTRVSRQKSGGYPVAAGETNPGESACPSVSLLLFPLRSFFVSSFSIIRSVLLLPAFHSFRSLWISFLSAAANSSSWKNKFCKLWRFSFDVSKWILKYVEGTTVYRALGVREPGQPLLFAVYNYWDACNFVCYTALAA